MGNSTAWNLRGRLDGSDKQLFTFQEERGSLVCVCARVALQALAISHHFPVLTLRTLHPIPLMKLWMGPMIKPVQRFERSNSAGGPRPGQPRATLLGPEAWRSSTDQCAFNSTRLVGQNCSALAKAEVLSWSIHSIQHLQIQGFNGS